MTTLPRYTVLCMAASLTACGYADEPPAAEETSPAEAAFTVSISEPAEGVQIDGPDLTVRLTAGGVRIAPAGEVVEASGHHHLYLDADLTAAGTPVPTEPGRIIHMGDGSEAYVFEGVQPGEHRLIAVVADGIHMPLQPWVVDTVRFTVR